MGTIIHDAICVTGCGEDIEAAHAEAVRLLGDLVTPIGKERVNGYRTFFVEPDGSKERWAHSDEKAELREQFMSWLATARMIEWAAVRYGDDLETYRHGIVVQEVKT